jgi:phage repressor protein C with HTH and peptisase S24 domain
MGLGQRIKRARELVGWDQAELSRQSGVAQPTLSALETRDSNRSQYGEQLINALPADKVNRDWVRTGKGHPEPIHYVSEAQADYASTGASPTMQPILAWEHPEDLPPGEFVMIPRLDVRLSAGLGREQVEIEFIEKQPQAFRAEWIRKKRLKPTKLASMVASGDSMEDRIHDGDALVVDTSQVEVIDGKVYALWYEGGERVKRLFRQPGGGLRIHSDNIAKYQDIMLTAAETEHVRIIGRVVHIAGEGGL